MTDVTAKYRDGSRVVKQGRADYLLPTIVHCRFARRRDREEGIHVPVRHASSSARGEDARGDRPDAGVHGDHLQRGASERRLLDAMHIDRLNLGPVPTTPAELAAAARRQHRRVPVPGAGVSERGDRRMIGGFGFGLVIGCRLPTADCRCVRLWIVKESAITAPRSSQSPIADPEPNRKSTITIHQ